MTGMYSSIRSSLLFHLEPSRLRHRVHFTRSSIHFTHSTSLWPFALPPPICPPFCPFRVHACTSIAGKGARAENVAADIRDQKVASDSMSDSVRSRTQFEAWNFHSNSDLLSIRSTRWSRGMIRIEWPVFVAEWAARIRAAIKWDLLSKVSKGLLCTRVRSFSSSPRFIEFHSFIRFPSLSRLPPFQLCVRVCLVLASIQAIYSRNTLRVPKCRNFLSRFAAHRDFSYCSRCRDRD